MNVPPLLPGSSRTGFSASKQTILPNGVGVRAIAIGTAVCAAIILLLVIIWGSGRSKEATAIELVLAQDKEVARQANKQADGGTAIKVAIRWQVEQMDAIDISACPTDFAEAYVRHRAAWQALLDAVDQEPDGFADGLWKGFLNGLTGEGDGGVGRMRHAQEQAIEEVRTTWTEVEASSVRHHAKLPPK